MPQKPNADITPPVSLGELNFSDERFREACTRFVVCLRKNGFQDDLIACLDQAILQKIDYEHNSNEPRSLFLDLGWIETGFPDGRYLMRISDKTVQKRTQMLQGKVLVEDEENLGYAWMLGHELGHAVQSAYGLLHQGVYETGQFEGLPYHPRPQEVFLARHPSSARHNDPNLAMTIERERQAEGFARLLLTEEMLSRGVMLEQANEVLDGAYKKRLMTIPPAHRTPDYEFLVGNFDEHELGYSDPLDASELHLRFGISDNFTQL